MLKNMDRLISSDEIKKTCRALSIIFVFLFSANVVASAAPNADAQKLSGNFLISTTKLKQTLENLIVQKKPIAGTYEKPLTFSALIPISVNNVQYNLDWQSVQMNPIADNNIQFALVQPQVNIVIPKIDIDTYLTKEVAGVTLRVHVQSSCDDIRLVTSTDAITVRAGITGSAKSDHVNMSANVTDINLGTPKLTIQNLKCNNIVGFEDIVADQILQQFTQIDFFKPVLLSKVNALIATQVEKYAAKAEKAIKDQVMTIDGLSAPLFSLLQINEKYIDVGFALNNPDATLNPIMDYTMNSDGAMIVDKTQLQDYLKQSLSAKLAKSYSSKSITELDKLTKSRFKQFFVFPGLMKLPKGQELILRPMLESLSFTLKPDSYVSSLNITATAGVWLMARNEAMVYLRSNIQATSNVANTAQVKTSIQSLKSSPVWDNNFLSKYGPSKRISTSIVDSTAESFFNDNWATQNLSVLKLTDTVSASLKKIFYSKDNKLYFELGLN